jgi:hypothetical protein
MKRRRRKNPSSVVESERKLRELIAKYKHETARMLENTRRIVAAAQRASSTRIRPLRTNPKSYFVVAKKDGVSNTLGRYRTKSAAMKAARSALRRRPKLRAKRVYVGRR